MGGMRAHSLSRFGLFDVAIQCRAGPRNVQISSHEVSKCTASPHHEMWQLLRVMCMLSGVTIFLIPLANPLTDEDGQAAI
jgi:hypothetical protein